MQQHFDPVNKFTYTLDENNRYHSFDDRPAIEYTNTSEKIWMKHGVLDRDYKKGPAMINNTSYSYYKDGLLHNPTGYAHRRKHYLNGIECKLTFNQNKMHGLQEFLIDEKWRKEIWIDGNKIEYPTLNGISINYSALPIIIDKNKNEILILAYCYLKHNFDDALIYYLTGDSRYEEIYRIEHDKYTIRRDGGGWNTGDYNIVGWSGGGEGCSPLPHKQNIFTGCYKYLKFIIEHDKQQNKLMFDKNHNHKINIIKNYDKYYIDNTPFDLDFHKSDIINKKDIFMSSKLIKHPPILDEKRLKIALEMIKLESELAMKLYGPQDKWIII
jgi:hypothetical protein